MRGILRSAVARATMTGEKLLTAALLGALAVTACSSQGAKNHLNLSVTKQHLRGPQPIPLKPYTVDWRACVVSVIPYSGQEIHDDAEYIIQFPDTVKKLRLVNVYESPRDLYMALESFPGVPTECLPPPSTIPTTYPQATSPPQPTSPPPTTPSVPSAQCVLLEPGQTYCRSSDPTIILEAQNNGDTSGCTFSDKISWADGSEQTVQIQGADNVPQVVASHTYEKLGGYGISDTVTVVAGDCTAIDGEYTFAYVTG